MTTNPFWIHHRALANEQAKERKRKRQSGAISLVLFGIALTIFYFLFKL